MESWRLKLFAYLSNSWGYRWQGLAAAWVVCVLGWVGVALIPNTYKLRAEVYIDTHTLLPPLLKGLAVTTDPNQEIAVTLQTLLTDPTLQRVLHATNPEAPSMSSGQMQNAIGYLRKKISLENLGAKDLYRITYRDGNPAHAQSVAQTLVSVLIHSSLGSQRGDADQVGIFLDNQIANYEQKLEAADKRRADFKTANLEFFTSTPDGDKVGGAGDVVAAQAAVTQAQKALDEAVNRRDALRAQLRRSPQLAAAIAKLNVLRSQYSDEYPDVVAQKSLIARLKSQQPAETYAMIMSKPLADKETDVAIDRNRLNDAKKRLEDAKMMTNKAFTVQREYEVLDRDYQVLHKNYQALVSSRESAKISEAAGDQQSFFLLRVISPPLKPDLPVAPNRLLLNAAVLLLGIGAGGGLAFALGQFSGRFVSIEQLKEAFELPVLGAVTTVRTGADMVAALRTIFFVAGLGLLVVSCLVVLFFFHTGVVGGVGPLL